MSYYCLFQHKTWISLSIALFVLNDLRWEIFIHFVDTDGIVDTHCLNFYFIIYLFNSQICDSIHCNTNSQFVLLSQFIVLLQMFYLVKMKMISRTCMCSWYDSFIVYFTFKKCIYLTMKRKYNVIHESKK